MGDETANITVAQVAEVFGMGAPSVRALCKSKSMTYTKIGGNGIRFKQSDIDNYVMRNPNIFKKPLSEYQIATNAKVSSTSAIPDGMLDVNEAAEVLGMSKWTIREKTREGLIPSYDGPNRRRLYRYEELMQAKEALGGAMNRHKPPETDDGERLMRIDEAANKCGLPVDTLRAMVRRGECRCIRNNDKGTMWFTDEIIEEFLDDNGVVLVPGVDWQKTVKVGEAAARLGITADEVRRLCDSNELGYVKSFTGKRMFREEDLARYEAKRDRIEYIPKDDEPYITQASFDAERRKQAERAHLESTMTPEELAEYDAKKAAREAIRQASRESARAERLASHMSEQMVEDSDATSEEEYNSPYDGMTVIGVEGRGNVVSVYLSDDSGPSPIADKLDDDATIDDMWQKVMYSTDAIVTLAWTLDVIVSTDQKPFKPKAARTLMENRDLPLLVLLEEDEYSGGTNPTLAMAGASTRGTRWYFGDAFTLPENAVMLTVDDWREDKTGGDHRSGDEDIEETKVGGEAQDDIEPASILEMPYTEDDSTDSLV